MTNPGIKKRISLRLSGHEALEIAGMRQSIERQEKRPVTVRAALRAALRSAVEASGLAMDFERIGDDSENRMELVIDESMSQVLGDLQKKHPGLSQSAVVLACARFARKKINKSFAGMEDDRAAIERRP